MATIVREPRSGGHYILLGAGFGAYKSTHPSMFFGSLAPWEDSGEVSVVAVCDHEGRIGWLNSHELQVVSIDGKAPGEYYA